MAAYVGVTTTYQLGGFVGTACACTPSFVVGAYRLSKRLAEQAAWDFSREHGLDVVVINPSFVMVGSLVLFPAVVLAAAFLVPLCHCCLYLVGLLCCVSPVCAVQGPPLSTRTDGTSITSTIQVGCPLKHLTLPSPPPPPRPSQLRCLPFSAPTHLRHTSPPSLCTLCTHCTAPCHPMCSIGDPVILTHPHWLLLTALGGSAGWWCRQQLQRGLRGCSGRRPGPRGCH